MKFSNNICERIGEKWFLWETIVICLPRINLAKHVFISHSSIYYDTFCWLQNVKIQSKVSGYFGRQKFSNGICHWSLKFFDSILILIFYLNLIQGFVEEDSLVAANLKGPSVARTASKIVLPKL